MAHHPTTETGYQNRNGQINIRPLNLPGTDHGQSLYHLACTHCGTNYAANGSDIHLRKCPSCQGGNPSTGGWKYSTVPATVGGQDDVT